jgi:transcriptional regulator with XRE-family HTH domain
MPTAEEKAAFSERLKFTMKRAPERLRGSTDLSLHFNLRHHGEHPVSTQTVHKWLRGRTIPTDDKLRTLAAWFKVEVHWLHYGAPSGGAGLTAPKPLRRDGAYPLSSEAADLASKIEALSPHHRYLLQELIAELYGETGSR